MMSLPVCSHVLYRGCMMSLPVWCHVSSGVSVQGVGCLCPGVGGLCPERGLCPEGEPHD